MSFYLIFNRLSVEVGCLNKYISKQTFIFAFSRQREFKLQFVYISPNTNKVETSWRLTLEMAMWTKHMFRWRSQEPAQTIKEQVNVIFLKKVGVSYKVGLIPRNVFITITSSGQYVSWKSNEPEWRLGLKYHDWRVSKIPWRFSSRDKFNV